MANGRLKLLYGQAYEVWLLLRTIDGQFADLRQYRGKIVLLAFFPITMDESTRYLTSVYRTHREQGVEVVHVTTAGSLQQNLPDLTEAEVAAWIAERQFPWRVAYDGKDAFGGLLRRLGLNAYPTYLLLSRDGRFVSETNSSARTQKAIETELAFPR